jgi:flagellin-like protein
MKGISPLIAVIFLIAFVLVMSGIFYTWLWQFSFQQREEFQLCSQASILLARAHYNDDTGNVNLVVHNTGRVDLTGFSVLVINDNGSVTPNKDFLGKELKKNDIGTFTIGFNQNMKEFVVQAIECKNAQDMITKYDVEGL